MAARDGGDIGVPGKPPTLTSVDRCHTQGMSRDAMGTSHCIGDKKVFEPPNNRILFTALDDLN